MNWKPGDIAMYVGVKTEHQGAIVTVISEPMIWHDNGREYVQVEPQLSSRTGVFCCSLRPIDDDYDGHQVTTWDKCVWQPAVTV